MAGGAQVCDRRGERGSSRGAACAALGRPSLAPRKRTVVTAERLLFYKINSKCYLFQLSKFYFLYCRGIEEITLARGGKKYGFYSISYYSHFISEFRLSNSFLIVLRLTMQSEEFILCNVEAEFAPGLFT